MSLKILTLITLLTSTQLVYAENHLLLLGGGGEPEGKETSFDDILTAAGSSLKNLQWNYDISFNGGHSNTEDIIKNNFSKSISPPTRFTSKNYEKIIEDYKLKINKGQIKSGDQLMIFINSHGGERESGQLSHTISASKHLDNLEASKDIDLDSLQEIIELTNKKGIKLGIVDASCFAGNTLALKKSAPNTCIVTATGPEHYSFGGESGFTYYFFKEIKPGLSIEEVFLNARLSSSDPAYPMISTSENNQIVKDMYASITPYLYFYSPFDDQYSNYIFENGSDSQMCKRNEDMEEMISKINDLKAIATKTIDILYAENLKYLLIKYKSSQDIVLEDSSKLNSPTFDGTEVFVIPPEARYLFGGEDKWELTWKELASSDYQTRINKYEAIIKGTSSKNEKKEAELLMNIVKTVNNKKEEIVKNNPQLLSYVIQTKKIMKQVGESDSIVDGIAIAEKVFYDRKYRATQESNSSDPCKSIVF